MAITAETKTKRITSLESRIDKLMHDQDVARIRVREIGYQMDFAKAELEHLRSAPVAPVPGEHVTEADLRARLDGGAS
jgi:hypothetical protein